MINRRANRKKTLVLVVALTIAALSLLGFITAETAADTAEIERLIRASVELAMTASELPEPFRSNPNAEIPDYVRQRMTDKIVKEFSEIYASGSALLERVIEAYTGDVLWQARDNFRALGGGIRKIENLTISIDGDKATAQADITKYKRLMESDNRVFTPENTSRYKFTLIKEGGRWRIYDEEWEILGGI